MAQENINFGAYPNDINSDAIRNAFEKSQNNFTELYGISTSFGVNQLTPGAGITVSSPSGNVTLNANIFNVQLKSQSMVLGPSAFVSTSGGNSTVTITNSGTPITIEMPANITGTSVSVTGNVSAGNIVTPGVVISSNISSTGNITAPYFFGNIVGNVSGNLSIGGTNTQVVFNDNGVANATSGFTFNKTSNAVSITGNANVANLLTDGLISASGNITGGNISTSGTLTVSGNITAGNIGATRFVGNLSGTGNSNVGNLGATAFYGSGVGLTNIPGANVTGTVANATYATSAGSTTTSGTVTTAAQPNITSVGTLTSLSVSGNANIGNIGVAGQLISSVNANTAPFIVVSSTRVSNLNADLVDGYQAETTNTANTIVVRDVSSNIAVGNVSTVGVFATTLSATGNANVGNIGAALFVGRLSGTGNSNVGNLGITGLITSTGNITGGNLITGGQLSASGNASVLGIKTDNYYYANGVAISFAGAYSNTDVASYLPTYTGTVGATALTTGSNITAGTITGNWSLSAGSRLSATYADLAEYYQADQQYAPGTVLMFGGEKEVTIAEANTNKVAGVVSTNPAYIMNSGCDSDLATALALQGRVPTKVIGNISKGDMMVSAGNGFATASAQPSMGSVIGKSLENFSGTTGVIEIVVGRL